MPLPEDLPPHERPRERLLRHGPASLRDAELLALALRTGTRGRTAIDMGSLLLHRYGEQAAPRSEEHTSELQSLMRSSYAVFCLKKPTHKRKTARTHTSRSTSS